MTVGAPLTTIAPVTAEWFRCPACQTFIYGKRFVRDLSVCHECGWHARLDAPRRVAQLLDEGSIEPLASACVEADPLKFNDTKPYRLRIAAARDNTGLNEAVVCARGTIGGLPVIVAAMDFRFIGGSLGTGVGELITSAAETALAERTPLLIVCASGGARMQEGALSLMQMAKTSQALGQLDEAGILTISLITDPTYGGVAASFATLTDVIIAEPGARMGFAGPRIIEQTIRQTLPPGFQTAEFLLSAGQIDDVCPRSTLRPRLADLLATNRRPDLPTPAHGDAVLHDAGELEPRPAWEVVALARHIDRPSTLDYVRGALDGFHELHGDRISDDSPSIVGGIGRLADVPVVVIGHQKGSSTRELIARNFGMPMPSGYRKAARLMRLAAKLGLPVITLLDTPGAYPGIAAEEQGQAVAIAENLRLMAGLPVPIVAVITGEGGSGGALALGVADRVLACANAVYSVISPEGCASILWKTTTAAPQAAEALRMCPTDLLALGIIDGVVPEPPGGAHTDRSSAIELLRAALVAALGELMTTEPTELVGLRRARFRAFGAPRQDQGASL